MFETLKQTKKFCLCGTFVTKRVNSVISYQNDVLIYRKTSNTFSGFDEEHLSYYSRVFCVFGRLIK